MSLNAFPALHNAMWPGLVGKGPDSEPPIDLDTMLNLTAGASVDGTKFDGVDLFLFDPHVSIDASDADLKSLSDKIARKGFVVGSLVAPVWPPTSTSPRVSRLMASTPAGRLSDCSRGTDVGRRRMAAAARPRS